MELLTGLTLFLVHAASAYGLWWAGAEVLKRPWRWPLRTAALAGLSLGLSALNVLLDFLLVLGFVQACARFHPDQGAGACERLSEFHVVFVFTTLLPLVPMIQVGLYFLKAMRRPPAKRP